MARDLYYSIQGYKNGLERLRNDTSLNKKNRELAVKWIEQKEKQLFDGYSPSERDKWAIRHSKTLSKYVLLLGNVCCWFPDLSNITEKQLTKFKDDFYSDKIKSRKGRIIKSKMDYVSKVIRSDFFKHFLGHRDIVEKVFTAKLRRNEPEVEFVTEEEVKKIVINANQEYLKVAVYLMFSTGLRIGTLLNLKFEDFELKHNVNNNMSYYLVHVKADYTKSKKDRTVPVVIPEANKLLKEYLTHFKKGEIVFSYSHQGLNKTLKNACIQSDVRTKPTNKLVTPHVLRKSASVYLLNKKYSIDQVKAMLGHKPSSTVIDRYVNYLGLGFEAEINNVQNDSYEKVKSELENVKSQMLVLEQKLDSESKKNRKIIDKALKSLAKKV